MFGKVITMSKAINEICKVNSGDSSKHYFILTQDYENPELVAIVGENEPAVYGKFDVFSEEALRLFEEDGSYPRIVKAVDGNINQTLQRMENLKSLIEKTEGFSTHCWGVFSGMIITPSDNLIVTTTADDGGIAFSMPSPVVDEDEWIEEDEEEWTDFSVTTCPTYSKGHKNVTIETILEAEKICLSKMEK